MRALPTPSELDRARWRGQRGHYEAWYLTLHDPGSGRGFWFRWTLHAPRDASRPVEAGLWAVSFEPGGGGAAGRDVYPAARFHADPGPGGLRLVLGPGALGPDLARGEVGAGAERLAWDLRFSHPAGRSAHVHPALFALGLAGTCATSPALQVAVSGVIEVGGRRLELREVPGERGHVWGRRHAWSWAWAHAQSFDGRPACAFDGVSARVRALGRALPPGTPLHLQLEGRDLVWNEPWALWSPESRWELGRWEFTARRGDLELRGRAEAPPEAFVAVEYEDPGGRRLWCHHAEQADLELELRRGGEIVERLAARGSAALEIAGPEPDLRVTRRLPLEAGRSVDDRAAFPRRGSLE